MVTVFLRLLSVSSPQILASWYERLGKVAARNPRSGWNLFEMLTWCLFFGIVIFDSVVLSVAEALALDFTSAARFVDTHKLSALVKYGNYCTAITMVLLVIRMIKVRSGKQDWLAHCCHRVRAETACSELMSHALHESQSQGPAGRRYCQWISDFSRYAAYQQCLHQLTVMRALVALRLWSVCSTFGLRRCGVRWWWQS